MEIPFEPYIFGVSINIHLILEYLAFFLGFRYYIFLRKKQVDIISANNRLSIVLGAIIGALLGSRIMGILEHPIIDFSNSPLMEIYNLKTIMGGLFGGLIGVEVSKKIIGEKHSSGDLFTLPIILGIFIGRIGCFLSGMNEFTYGTETSFLTGMDLGDQKMRHPVALYELLFLAILFLILKQWKPKKNGRIFVAFMLAYFGFRFLIEFLKPNTFLFLELSSTQWLCIVCWIYYSLKISKEHLFQLDA